MCFTDQKPRIVTEEECKALWSGGKNGIWFRCYICGHKFVAGDVARFVMGKGTINFHVCDKCDSDDIALKFKKIYEESLIKYWWIWKNVE